MTVFIGPVLVGDIKSISISCAPATLRQRSAMSQSPANLCCVSAASAWAWPLFNSMGAKIEQGLGEVALATGQLGEAETRFRRSIKLMESSIKDLPHYVSQPPSVSDEKQT
jgi:hypothetical protein